MKIDFCGAAGSVTGSCHALKINGKLVLLDCGLYQGKDEKDYGNETFSFNPKDVDYILISHAHIDHIGRIPLLYKQGFKGKIYCTEATRDLARVMLIDSGHIQEQEVEWKNRKRQRQGLDPIEPLYTAKIAELSSYLISGYPYDSIIEIFDGLKIRFRDAGHLLGSAIIELFINENGNNIKLVYSGDLGNINIPLLKDPALIEDTDYLLMETTYGNRDHEKIQSQVFGLVDIIKSTMKKGGNVIIPSFAVGRTQEVLYELNNYIEDRVLKDIKVYVDSPLADEATKIFEDYRKYYDEDALKILQRGDDPLKFEGLKFTKSAEDSMKLNKITTGAVIISASGMCDAGRIRHHLKHNLWRRECSIVFVGYQAEGTLGRALIDGARKVKLFGEEIAVNAKIINLPGLSGHADRSGLLRWLHGFKEKPKKVILIHGDNEERESFKDLIMSEGYNVFCPKLGDTFDTNLPFGESKVKNEIYKILDSYNNIEGENKEEILAKIKQVLDKCQ